MKMYAALFWMMVGAAGVLAIDDIVIPRVEGGWDKIDDQRKEYCVKRSRKWYRKATFQVNNTYHKCMAREI